MLEFVPANRDHAFPVSVKGMAVQDGRVPLLQNGRSVAHRARLEIAAVLASEFMYATTLARACRTLPDL